MDNSPENICSSCPKLEADPDIAGIGVLVAFIATAISSLITTILYMLVQRKSAGDGINPIDKFLRQHTSDRVQRVLGARRSHLMAKSLYDVILSLSDTQLVTGTAMLVAALYKLNETGSISIYHLSIVEDSCFIIPSIHSFTFFALRTRTESSESASEDTGQARRRKKPTGIEWSLILRVALTLSLNVMLFYIRWTSAYVDWDSKYACPATCALGKPKSGKQKGLAIFYLVWILDIYACCWFQIYGRWPWAGAQSYISLLLYIPLYICMSEFVYVIMQLGVIGVEIRLIFHDRSKGHSTMGVEESSLEDTWGFGQLVPLLLLTLPVLQWLESMEEGLEEPETATLGSDNTPLLDHNA